MGLDQLLELTSSVASKALPICGVVVLIFLAVLVKHLIVLLTNATDAVVTMALTLGTTNRQLETLDKPLNTLNELSETVDCVHEASKHAVRSTLVAVIENFSSIKDWVFAGMKKEDDRDEEDGVSD